MKKKLITFLVIMLLPFNVWAYSDYIIPGGETLGIEINTEGIMVIGFYQIHGKYNKGNPVIKAGDYITKINDETVNTIKELTHVIEESVEDKVVDVTFLRKGKEKVSKLELVEDDGIYKTGLYVKDSVTGIGTLSYIDPETKIFAALGHEIIESTTNEIVEIKTGTIFRNYITSIDKSITGVAGSKNAKFYYETKYGKIVKNTNVGIYGIYESVLPDKELMQVGNFQDVSVGNATIYTVLDGEKIEEFGINITSVNETSKTKNISFEIDSNELIDKTGGIVQGMSGSPIIQDNKIIGVVTHVIIDNPLTGYGIFITTMLEAGEK